MVVVTHEMSFARDVANKVYFMDGGVVVESGTPQEVLLHPKEGRTKQFFRRINEMWSITYNNPLLCRGCRPG